MSDDDFEGGEPPEDDLPPTGPHHLLPGDEGEGGEGIPSFEDYRRAREDRGPGGWSPFGPGAQSGRGGEAEGGEDEEPPLFEEAGEVEDTLPVRGREPAEAEGDEEGGDTLDGGESLADIGFGGEVEDWRPRRVDENGDPITFEEQLAEAAGDVLPTGFEHSAEEIHLRRLAAHRRHRRNGRIRLLILVAVVALIALIVVHELGGTTHKPKATKPPVKHVASLPTSAGSGAGYLAKGSDPSVLPANLLIADWGARRLLVVSPRGQIVWSYRAQPYQSLFNPDYAFFNAAGDSIVISQESHSQVGQLDVVKKRFVYHYGHYGHAGSGVDYLHDPGVAIELSDGKIIVADIRNCRVAVLTPPHHTQVHDYGHVGRCAHGPPRQLDNPVSAFPLRGGGLVITELGGYVDLISGAGKLTASVRVPGFKRPLAANEMTNGDLVAVDHTHPGAVEIFTKAGKLLWHYKVPAGKRELFDPSMALVLPDGNVLVSDDYNSRVIVIDRATKKIVWQYGHLHARSAANGYLYLPVGIDLVHPYSLLDASPGATAPR